MWLGTFQCPRLPGVRLVIKPRHSGSRFHVLILRWHKLLSLFYIRTNIFHSKLPRKYFSIIDIMDRQKSQKMFFQTEWFSIQSTEPFLKKYIQISLLISEIIPDIKTPFFFSHPKIFHPDVNTWSFLIYLQDKLPFSHLLNKQYLIWAGVIPSVLDIRKSLAYVTNKTHTHMGLSTSHHFIFPTCLPLVTSRIWDERLE